MDYSSDQLTNQYTSFSKNIRFANACALRLLPQRLDICCPSLFSRTRSAHLTIATELGFDASQLSLEIDTLYWESGTMAFVSLHTLDRNIKLTDNRKHQCSQKYGAWRLPLDSALSFRLQSLPAS
jgi:hypothetical protein